MLYLRIQIVVSTYYALCFKWVNKYVFRNFVVKLEYFFPKAYILAILSIYKYLLYQLNFVFESCILRIL